MIYPEQFVQDMVNYIVNAEDQDQALDLTRAILNEMKRQMEEVA